MAKIELRNLAHSYTGHSSDPADFALHEMNHVWEDGGAYALLGPSGCGKTTLLNIISGLVQPSQGQVLFDETQVNALPTERRNVAQVFQFPVLYDTMSVFDNLAFPLRNRGLPESRIRKQVEETAEMLDLGGVLKRKAVNLGADAKQKISVGRGLVRTDVAAVLFDEPLTVIDPHLKWHLRRKLKEIHERVRRTLVYVTHDQTEALTFADRVVVMSQGEVLQLGTPQELFERPEHTFVGYFIGSPGMNFLDCELDGDAARVQGHRITLANGAGSATRQSRARLQLGIRPEFLRLTDDEGSGVPARVEFVEDRGTHRLVKTRVGDAEVFVKLGEDEPVPADRAVLQFPPEWTLLYADNRLAS